MSFSADWLALREPVDHAARNGDVLADVVAHFSGRDHLAIVDLGCGAGSNLRGLALSLPASRQSWTLVDYDPALLDAARASLSAWADHAQAQGEELLLEKSGKTLSVDFRQLDLNRDVETVAGWRPDLITAAALFDLVSAPWIARFVATLARYDLPLYTVLTYDGRESWVPPHLHDADIHAAFLAHQGTDKGFGISAGPGAGAIMSKAFAAAGYSVSVGDSPWRIGPAHAELARQLSTGIAHAALETGRVQADAAQAWTNFRHQHAADAAAMALVGHVDLFAVRR
ncbi:MAG: class I SAM-dependent methyltransferase [Beijerinckiaceae bacterium]